MYYIHYRHGLGGSQGANVPPPNSYNDHRSKLDTDTLSSAQLNNFVLYNFILHDYFDDVLYALWLFAGGYSRGGRSFSDQGRG